MRYCIAVVMVLLLSLTAQSYADEIDQAWTIQVAVGDDGGPCDTASARLQIVGIGKAILHDISVPLEPAFAGISIHNIDVHFDEPGTYAARAVLVTCDGTVFESRLVPIKVDSSEESRSVWLVGDGAKDSWGFTYFGVTTERAAGDLMTVEKTHPLTLHNSSTHSLTPCRQMLGPQVQRLELVRGQWGAGPEFQFPDDLDELPSGASVELQMPRVRIIRKKDADEPEPSAYALRIQLSPPRETYQYFDASGGDSGQGPFPGSCDTYYVSYEIPARGVVGDGNDG